MEQNDKRYRQREVASSWNHFLNQRDGPTFHCSFELFFVLTQLQRGNDLVISTSSIITAFFYPSNIYSISDDRWTKTE